jgi:hypothetical protein
VKLSIGRPFSDYQDVPDSHGIAAMPSFVDIPSEAVVASALPSTTRKYLHLRGSDPNTRKSFATDHVAPETPESPTVADVIDDEHYDIDGRCRSILHA